MIRSTKVGGGGPANMKQVLNPKIVALALSLLLAAPATAYVGPGAGFAFVGSFLSLLAAFAVGAASLLIFPFRIAWRALRGAQG